MKTDGKIIIKSIGGSHGFLGLLYICVKYPHETDM
jgi:hypothetical protein